MKNRVQIYKVYWDYYYKFYFFNNRVNKTIKILDDREEVYNKNKKELKNTERSEDTSKSNIKKPVVFKNTEIIDSPNKDDNETMYIIAKDYVT